MGFGKGSILVLIKSQDLPHNAPTVATRMTCLDLIKACTDARWIKKTTLCDIVACVGTFEYEVGN